jgi:hypothetical protein
VPSQNISGLPMELSRAKSEMEPGQICAYNRTRECFLGLRVVAGEFTAASFQEWMATIRPNSGAGMWMIPFRGIEASDVRVPLDLLYLDEECRVIEAVEFFPTFRVSASSPAAASVLVLPTHSIFSSQTQAGDRLMLHSADEIEWRLDRFAQAGPEVDGSGNSFAVAARPMPAGQPLGPVLVREKPKEPARSVVLREQLIVCEQPVSVRDPIAVPGPVAEAEVREELKAAVTVPPEAGYTVVPTPAILQPVPQAAPQTVPEDGKQQDAKPWLDVTRQAGKAQRGWLGRWLFSDSADPRRALRQPVPGLVAHFFTGGAPIAHEIRDVSASGLFVVTAERWYPGTIIRMTLTKPGAGQTLLQRSITIQARSVRWGNDGVGLEFVLEPSARPKRSQAAQFDPADGEQLEQFLPRPKKKGR